MNKTVWNVSVFAVLLLIVPLLQGGGMRVCAQNTNPKESIEVYVEPSDGAVLLYDAPKGKTVSTLEEKGEYISLFVLRRMVGGGYVAKSTRARPLRLRSVPLLGFTIRN